MQKYDIMLSIAELEADWWDGDEASGLFKYHGSLCSFIRH